MKDSLLKEIKRTAYLNGEFTTRAGKKTNYYIDKYLFQTIPNILDPLTDELCKLLPDSDQYDRIAAPELGAVALASVLSIKAKKPFLIVRKQGKGYGTDNLIEGKFAKDERIVLVEDVLTTGGAAIKAADILEDNKMKIIEIIGVINREEGAIENINNKGWKANSLITATQLHNSL